MPSRLLVQTKYHLVLRGGWNADGIERERGEVVRTDGWRNVQPLVNVRQLAPLAEDVEPVPCPCGRNWTDDDAALAHIERGSCPDEVPVSKTKTSSKPGPKTSTGRVAA